MRRRHRRSRPKARPDLGETSRRHARRICSRRACGLVTPLDGGAPWLLRMSDAVDDISASTLRAGRSALVEHRAGPMFVYVHRPPTRLVIVGAAHVAQALAAIARVANFEVVVIDPRAAFAASERFPDTVLIPRWPDEALPALGLDAFTALAALSHDPKIDDAALCIALASNCFYVGALGSAASQARRAERLKARGVAPDALARLRAPIELDIAAVSPTEIAVAVMARDRADAAPKAVARGNGAQQRRRMSVAAIVLAAGRGARFGPRAASCSPIIAGVHWRARGAGGAGVESVQDDCRHRPRARRRRQALAGLP